VTTLTHQDDMAKILPDHVSAIRPFHYRGATFYVAICRCGRLHTRETFEEALAASKDHAAAGQATAAAWSK